jgi:WD40 repeat protein
MTLSRHWFAAAVILFAGVCGRVAIAGDAAAPPRSEREPLPGLLAAPRPLPGIGRWQLAYKIPRGRILAIAWSSDGRQIAYQEASAIRICDARTFETSKILLGHSQQVRSIDWNRTNHLIASTSFDGTVRIWSADGAPLTVLTSPHGPINCAAWAPNGDRLAWGGADGTVRIVKADGSTIRTFRAADAAVNCTAWSPDGGQIATGDDKHLTKIWNVDGTLAVTFASQQSPVSLVAWSSTGKRLATATLGVYTNENLQYTTEMRIWDAAGKEIAERSDSALIYGLEWSPDGLSLAVMGAGQLLTLNEAGKNQTTRNIGPLEGITSHPAMAWSPDGKRLAFGGIGQLVTLDQVTGELRESNASPYALPNYTYADWSSAGDRIAVVMRNGIEFRRSDGSLMGYTEHAILPFDGRGQIAWSPDGKRVVIRSGREPIVADPNGGPATVPFELTTPTQFVAWNAKTGLFASVARQLIRIAKPSGALESTFQTPGNADSLRWSADGTRLLVLQAVEGRRLFAVHVYNSAGESLAVLRNLKGEVDAVDISPDGKQLLLGYDAGYWEQWDLSDISRPRRTSPAHSFGSCTDVTYSPDGTRFATVGWEGLAKLWRADGKLLRTFDGHGGPLYSASFSPDGRHFVTAGLSPTVCIWSTESSRPETIIFYPNAEDSIVIAADGRFLSGPPKVIDASFVFLVEKPSGAMEILDSAAFRRRTGLKPFGSPEAAPNRLRAAVPRGVATRRVVGQRNDPDFDVKVPQPAYAAKHPMVGIDENHRNFDTAGHRYKPFLDLLSNDGYRVSAILDPFTARRLDDYDVLVVANAQLLQSEQKSAFTRDESESLQNWVRGGGGLLLIANQQSFASASAELAKSFGVEMGRQLAFDSAGRVADGLAFAREKNQLGDHAILRGRNAAERINRVLTFNGQSLTGPPGSVALLKFSGTATERGSGSRTSAAGRAQGLALKFGRGRVVVLGEANTLAAEIYGNPPRHVGMNVPDCDNRQLALNIVHWLSGLID